jgi:hypothetical protein
MLSGFMPTPTAVALVVSTANAGDAGMIIPITSASNANKIIGRLLILFDMIFPPPR